MRRASTSFSLGSDNHSGVLPEVLAAILAANDGHAPAYGCDAVTRRADAVFRRLFGEVAVSLVFNGTAANVLALRTLVPSFGSVLCTDVAHLHLDACAAAEHHIGCKVQALPHQDGKLTPALIDAQMVRQGDQHFAAPKAVSLTQPTELGTLYDLAELSAIGATCRRHNLRLHMDGARLVNAAAVMNVSFRALTQEIGVDVLSFGGTKNGLMGGEAVVFFDASLAKDFRHIRKQGMQLGAKQRFVAAQFTALLDKDLWRSNAHHAHLMAQRLAQGAASVEGVKILYPVQSNAVFAHFPRQWLKPLRAHSFFYVWQEAPFTVRWMTTFDTKPADVDSFLEVLARAAGRPDSPQQPQHQPEPHSSGLQAG